MESDKIAFCCIINRNIHISSYYGLQCPRIRCSAGGAELCMLATYIKHCKQNNRSSSV